MTSKDTVPAMVVFSRKLIAAAVVIALTAVVYEARIVGRQDTALQQLQSRHHQLTLRLADLRHQNEAVHRAPAAMQPEIPAGSVTASTSSTANLDAATALNSWIAQARAIRQLLSERPDLGIPELKLLSDSDWALATREAQIGTPEQIRKALAALRNAAKETFSIELRNAMEKYLAASGGQLPPTVMALAPYLRAAVGPEALPRYEILRSGNIADLPSDLPGGRTIVVQEKKAVDEVYDGRFGVFARAGRVYELLGGSNGNGRAWRPEPTSPVKNP